MPKDNVAIVRAWAEAFNRRDMQVLDDLSSASVEFRAYMSSMIETTTYRGHDGMRKYFEDVDLAWEALKVRVDKVRDFGEQFIATGELHGKGRVSGMEVAVPLAWDGEIVGGKVTRIHTHQTGEAAFEAADLPE